MLEVSRISKWLGRRQILRDVQLRGQPSEVIVLTGENGSGKTTLLRIMAGMIEPSSGSVRICGHDLAREPVLAKRHLGYVPDGLEPLPELLVSEFVALVAALKSHGRGERLSADAGWRERLGVHSTWNQRLRSLSFGQKKRVFVLAALIGAPDLLLLDEPSNGLDPAGVQLIVELIEERRQSGSLTLLSSNDAELVARLPATGHHLTAGELTQLPPVLARGPRATA